MLFISGCSATTSWILFWQDCKRFFQMVLEIVLRVFFETKAPGEAVENVRRHLIHSQRTRPLAFGFAAHPIGHDQQLALRAAIDARFII